MELSGSGWSNENAGGSPGVPRRREHLVVIGNGMAGCRAVEELLARDPARYRVTIFGAEPHVNYNRIMLSPVLAGEKAFEDIILNGHDWYRENQIELVTNDAVVAIDREAKRVTAASGRSVEYDRLLIATGSDPFIIPVPGHTLQGVIRFRDMADVDRMLAAADAGGDAVVIGGGLLGLEAAHGLTLRGMKVTVLHIMPTLMERQLDEAAGWLLQTALEARGQTILTGADTAEIVGETQVEGVRLKDGRLIPASLVVMAVGIRPNVKLARDAGLAIGRGVHVDDHMVTSDPAILAVGECVEHDGQVYGLVAPLFEMCRALADGLVEKPSGYRGSVTSTKLKVSGIDVFSAGDFSGGEGAEDIVLRDASRGVYKRLVVRDDRIVGAVLYGDTGDGGWYFDLLKRQEDVSELRDLLIFGQAFASGGGQADPKAAVAALSDDAEICGCNGVSKGQVAACIEKGACSLDAVRSGCKASASCGSCTGLVETLLALTLGDEVQAGPKTMCKCTSFGHDDVRREIVAQGMRSIPEVMQRLHWSTPDGCSSCRPALNYYLLCALPGDYVDDVQSRLVNERMHANIQKDGTYSVVPRMWGGITNPRELRDRGRGREVQRADGEGHRRPAARYLRDQEGGSARGLGRSQCRRDGLGPRLRQVAAHGEDLRRLRMVPLRHAGFDRARRPDRADDLGVVDAPQVQDRGLRVSPQLCRGDDQGLRRSLRGLRLRAFSWRQWRDQGPRHRLPLQGRDRARGDALLRRLRAALSRGGALSGAHRAVDRARRRRVYPRADRRRRHGPRRARRAIPVLADLQPGRPLG